MKQATICFPMRGAKILLGMKKRGFGAGKWNGFGGKVQDGESIEAAAARELAEESGLIAAPADFENVARIRFFETNTPIFDDTVFFLRKWEGVEKETEEMRPQWFDVLPYDAMWAADRLWIPLLLAGKKIDGTVRFKKGMDEVESFTYTERTK
jgi:8-oxo-dGTP diphosphatase